MTKVHGNGLVELVDERSEDSGWFCMALAARIRAEANDDPIKIGELWDKRFNEAKKGYCRYSYGCKIFLRTRKSRCNGQDSQPDSKPDIETRHSEPVQLEIEFD